MGEGWGKAGFLPFIRYADTDPVANLYSLRWMKWSHETSLGFIDSWEVKWLWLTASDDKEPCYYFQTRTWSSILRSWYFISKLYSCVLRSWPLTLYFDLRSLSYRVTENCDELSTNHNAYLRLASYTRWNLLVTYISDTNGSFRIIFEFI